MKLGYNPAYLSMAQDPTGTARKVVFVSNVFPSHREPLRGIYNLRQVLALRERGWEFSVVAPVFSFPLLRSRFGPPAAQVACQEVVQGLRTAHPRAWYVPGSRGALNASLYEWSIRRTVHRACDLTHPAFLWGAFAFPDGVALGRIARRRGLPHVVSVLGSDVNVGLHLKGRRPALLEGLGSARLVLAKSHALRDLLVEHGVDARRVAVVHNGVDRSLFRFRTSVEARSRLGVREDGRRILFVGHLVPVKAADVLLEAFALLPGDEEGVPDLTLVGEGHQRGKLETLARRLGIASRVSFVGSQSPEEVALWMNASDLLCLPSLHEGVPNVVLEALASGCPVIASRVGGVPEVHPGELAGALVEPGDPSALAHALEVALRRLWDRAALAASMTGASWATNAERVEMSFREAGLVE